ncbi:DUF4913 domain-containing protein (plasmid) [Nocardia sp. CA-084685]|uniref:DUF4913 domain-containing protein n=1 Tax=Nocardia sp. CA-084685 TaxID=3239970 RepID=UPI003D98D826
MTTESASTNYCKDLGEFVEIILLPLYPRLLIEASDLPAFQQTYPNLCDAVWPIRAWCAEWWKHPDAVVRLECIWREWEFMRRRGEDFSLSMWFTYHADHHMAVLMSPFGTFAGCSTTGGHNSGQTLHPQRHRPSQLPTAPIPPDLLAALNRDIPPPETDPPAETDPDRTDL